MHSLLELWGVVPRAAIWRNWGRTEKNQEALKQELQQSQEESQQKNESALNDLNSKSQQDLNQLRKLSLSNSRNWERGFPALTRNRRSNWKSFEMRS